MKFKLIRDQRPKSWETREQLKSGKVYTDTIRNSVKRLMSASISAGNHLGLSLVCHFLAVCFGFLFFVPYSSLIKFFLLICLITQLAMTTESLKDRMAPCV